MSAFPNNYPQPNTNGCCPPFNNGGGARHYSPRQATSQLRNDPLEDRCPHRIGAAVGRGQRIVLDNRGQQLLYLAFDYYICRRIGAQAALVNLFHLRRIGIVGWFANTAALLVAVEVLLLPVWLAKMLAVIASFTVNFSLSHFVVFRVRRSLPATT